MSTRLILPKTGQPAKKRTAAYCRVSSSSEEQLHSYTAQVKYYTETLSADKSCDFVGVYADVYNLKMIPFDTINAVQTPKITAFGGKTPVESRYFNFRKLFCLTAGFINAPSK